MPQEPRRIGDGGGPVAGVFPGVLVEDRHQIAACPAVAVDQLGHYVDEGAQMLAVVEAFCCGDELGGDDVCLARPLSPLGSW